jgi:hypothetical protein
VAVAAGTAKLTCDYDTLPLYAKPAIAVAAHGTSKHTSNLAKIGFLVRRLGGVKVAAKLQGKDSTRKGQGSKATEGSCKI